MLHNVSLNASMRANLLSLQQTSKLQDMTSNRLSTGLKVNSAIDNPSAYYTARSLSDRASDLNALLDAMSQGIQTLKAVAETIDAAAGFLQQAKAVASQALETAQNIVARVSTEEELLAAVSSGKKGLIILEKDIAMSDNQNIVLSDGQSLVGAAYLDRNAKNTSISFTFTGEAKSGIIAANNSLIANLNIDLSTDTRGNGGVIKANHFDNLLLKDINITMDTSRDTTSGDYVMFSGISGGNIDMRGSVTIKDAGAGNKWTMGINGSYADSLTLNSGASLIIETSGYRDMGIAYIGSLRIQDGSELTIHTTGNQGHALNDINTISVEGGSVLNITTEGESSYGTSLAAESSLNIHDSSVVNVKTFKSGSHGFYGGINNIFDKAQINIKTAGSSAEGINKSTINTYGQAILNVFTSGSVSDCIVSGTVNVRGNSVLNLNSSTAENAAAFCYDTINLYDRGIINAYGSAGAMYASTNMPLQLNIFSSLAVFNNYNKDLFFGNSNSLTAVAGAVINQSNGSYVSSSAVQSSGNSLPQEFVKKGDAVFDPLPNIDEAMNNNKPNPPRDEDGKSGSLGNIQTNKARFDEIIRQYDALINDGSYKGVNLLKNDSLKVSFNEDRSSYLNIAGVDASSQALGLTDADWLFKSDVEKSLSGLDAAIASLRDFAARFGTYNNIVTTRQEFTEAMINVLEEGADKLTLADMNQESANMLALQTRQMLAVNSLALASQASRAVLYIF